MPHLPQTLPFRLETDAMGLDGAFDSRYTCDSDNSSPELKWFHIPKETMSFALITKDLESPAVEAIHWVVYRIPAHINHLPAGMPPQESLPNGISQGINCLGKLGYLGPCPPIGDRKHHYQFRLYALNSVLDLGRRLTGTELAVLIEPFVISSAEVIGIYQRLIQKAG